MPFQERLYLRRAELTVGRRVSGNNAPVKPQDARVFRTRLSFEVSQDTDSNANKMKIDIYNLNEESRRFLEQKDLIVFLDAGYESTELSNIFFGEINNENGFRVSRNGPDIITRLECGDAEIPLRNANIQLGLQAGATNLQIVQQALDRLRISSGFLANIPTVTYRNGYSFSGRVKDLLDEMGRVSGFNWSIQNGELFIFTGNERTDRQEAVIVGPDTGLVGYPSKTDTKVEFKSVLNPRIRPGRAVILESQIFPSGIGQTLRVEKADIKGDTHEGEWITKVEGTVIT